jgi:riboflavin synthase
MFTGIITALGTVCAVTPIGGGKDMQIVIQAPWIDIGTIATGASIACSGCCLTVVDLADNRFTVDASAETLACTTLATWEVGTRVNLERSLKIGDELGGHLVSGHTDGVGEALSYRSENGSTRWHFRVPHSMARFIAVKGSVAVDGVSLTVNDVQSDTFDVNVIPYTTSVTGFGCMKRGDKVNIEVDIVARYVARLAEIV